MTFLFSSPVNVRTLVTVATFVLPAMALTIPSGYSWGALLLCMAALTALITSPCTARLHGALAWFGLSVLFMGAVYASDAWLATTWHWNALDKPMKFVLATFSIAAVVKSPTPPQALKWGIWSGAVGAGVTALWQVQVLAMDRAWGYTNAIQFGDIALLLGLWSGIWSYRDTGRTRWLGWLAGLAGLFACIASETRGAWVMIPVLGLVVGWQCRGVHPSSQASHIPRLAWVTGLVALGITLTLQWSVLENRLTEAREDVANFNTHRDANNSIGQRLAHWQLAYSMGTEKPWTGWGEEGYVREKQRRVDAGLAPPILASMGHAHNDWLELWVKKGLLGVLALLLLLAVPLVTYWRTLNEGDNGRNTMIGTAVNIQRGIRHTVALCGLTLVVGFFGFGQTQVMFAHNSGTMIYLFMNLLFLSACTKSEPMQSSTTTVGEPTTPP